MTTRDRPLVPDLLKRSICCIEHSLKQWDMYGCQGLFVALVGGLTPTVVRDHGMKLPDGTQKDSFLALETRILGGV